MPGLRTFTLALAVIAALSLVGVRSTRAAEQVVDYPVDVVCDSFPGPQLCEPVFAQDVDTEGILTVEYITSAGHCSSVRVFAAVDGGDAQASDFLGPGESSGVFDFSPVSAGSHTVAVQAEGTLGGCNTQGLEAWAGTIRITTSSTGTGDATVTIHKATCPTGVGGDIFEECHGNALAGVGFSVNGTAVTTDGDGVAGAEVDAGTVTVVEDAGTFADYLGAYVYCSEQHSGTVLYDGSADTRAVSFTVAAGDDVVCDWYDITEADTNPAPTATATSGGSPALPSTGTGPFGGGTSPSTASHLGLLGACLAALVLLGAVLNRHASKRTPSA